MDKFSEIFREVGQHFSKMSASQKLTLGMFILTISIIFVSIIFSAFQTQKEVLFRDLSKEEESSILSKLDSYGVKKEYKDGVILVEKGTRDNIMMRLSMDKALPEDKSWGFLANIKKGDSWLDTSESKRQKTVHAIEAELMRMIESLEKVASAKVVLSRDTQGKGLYSVENEKRTAIVTVKVKSGQKLTQNEAEGIATIVSSATATPLEFVKVVDTKSKTYSFGNEEGDSASSGKIEKWELTKKREADFAEKIKNVLSSYNRRSAEDIKVVVSLKMNLDKVVKKSDRVLPDETVVTTKTSKEEISRSVNGVGNTVGAEPNAGGNNNERSNGKEQSSSVIEKSQNVDFSREVTETVINPGTIETISVAVTLPFKATKDDKGIETEAPLDNKAIDDAKELVLMAVGDPLKSENITIKSVPYRASLVEDDFLSKRWYEYITDNIPPWFSPMKILLGAILIFVVMRLLNVTKNSQKILEEDALEEDATMEGKKSSDGNEDDLKMKELEENLNQVVREDLNKAANIIKRWAISG